MALVGGSDIGKIAEQMGGDDGMLTKKALLINEEQFHRFITVTLLIWNVIVYPLVHFLCKAPYPHGCQSI